MPTFRLEGYSLLTRIFMAALMAVPAVTNYLALESTHDAVYSSFAMIFIGYLLPMMLMHFFVSKSTTSNANASDSDDVYYLAKAAIIRGLVVGSVLGLCCILYCMFLNWGPDAITLPMPAYTGNKFYFYWALFFVVWVLALPIFEGYFFFGYQASNWDKAWADLMISGFYAAMNYCWLLHVVKPDLSVFILTGISFLVGYGCIDTRKRHSGGEAIGNRVGVAFGLFLMLVYLNSSKSDYKSPSRYIRFMAGNKFNWF